METDGNTEGGSDGDLRNCMVSIGGGPRPGEPTSGPVPASSPSPGTTLYARRSRQCRAGSRDQMDRTCWIATRTPESRAMLEQVRVATRISSKLSAHGLDDAELILEAFAELVGRPSPPSPLPWSDTSKAHVRTSRRRTDSAHRTDILTRRLTGSRRVRSRGVPRWRGMEMPIWVPGWRAPGAMPREALVRTWLTRRHNRRSSATSNAQNRRRKSQPIDRRDVAHRSPGRIGSTSPRHMTVE